MNSAYYIDNLVKNLKKEYNRYISPENIKRLYRDNKIAAIMVDEKILDSRDKKEKWSNFNYPWPADYMRYYGLGGWPPGLYTNAYNKVPSLLGLRNYYPGRFNFFSYPLSYFGGFRSGYGIRDYFTESDKDYTALDMLNKNWESSKDKMAKWYSDGKGMWFLVLS